jgi:hypothetical protein
MLVFCSHRGLSLECRKCAHSVAHEPIHRHGGPFTCDGGHQCRMALAVLGSGMGSVIDGEEKVYEVRCVSVDDSEEIRMVRKLQNALRGLLADGYGGFDRKTSKSFGNRVYEESTKFLESRK